MLVAMGSRCGRAEDVKNNQPHNYIITYHLIDGLHMILDSKTDADPSLAINTLGFLHSEPFDILDPHQVVSVSGLSRSCQAEESNSSVEPAEPVANRDPRDVEEIERLQQRIRELEFQQDERNEETESNSVVWDDGVRVEIPEFTGIAQPDEFIDWISTVERVFDLRDIPDNLKVKVVAIKLRNYASLWQNAFFEYHSLMQNSSSLEQFIADFDRLRMRCGADEDEEQVIARFLGALRPDIADIVQLQQFWTLDDVFRLALKVEKQLGNKTRSAPTRPFHLRSNSRTHRFNSAAMPLCSGQWVLNGKCKTKQR
ncbi:hypothetical protein Tco_0810476 [Tanacetum coccineum]